VRGFPACDTIKFTVYATHAIMITSILFLSHITPNIAITIGSTMFPGGGDEHLPELKLRPYVRVSSRTGQVLAV
jgi:hypothetical protein